jgi:hypothetical protein
MKVKKQPVILNSEGKPILLNAQETHHANWMQRQLVDKFGNSLGYEIPVTTLTTIMKKITEQKYYEIPPADFLPVRVGEGAWSSFLTTYRSFNQAGEFEQGIINTGSNNTRLANADAGVDAVNIKVNNWGKSIGWSVFDLQQAAKSGNWDIVTALEKSRKMNWDLGIQRVAFLGARGLNGSGGTCLGLLNQTSVNRNTSVITKPISTMSAAELKTFCGAAYEAYRANCNRTAKPTHFIVPESDFNGMASTVSPDFPIKSILQLLLEMFQTITGNKSFQILPLAYGDASYSGITVGGVLQNRYVMLNYDEETLRMDIPVDYTNTMANSIDGFSFQNAGYGQFTGVGVYRNLEVLYFDEPAA